MWRRAGRKTCVGIRIKGQLNIVHVHDEVSLFSDVALHSLSKGKGWPVTFITEDRNKDKKEGIDNILKGKVGILESLLSCPVLSCGYLSVPLPACLFGGALPLLLWFSKSSSSPFHVHLQPRSQAIICSTRNTINTINL